MRKRLKQKKDEIALIFQELKEHSTFYVSFGLLILLFSSFLYNFAYFLFLDLKLLGCLTLTDYYEGTIPYIVIFSIYSLVLYGLSISASKDAPSLKDIISCFFTGLFLLKEIFCILCNSFRAKRKLFRISKKLKSNIKELKEYSYSHSLKELKEQNQELTALFTRMKICFKKCIDSMIISIILLMFILIPIIPLSLLLKNWPIKLVIPAILLVFIFSQMIKSLQMKKIFFVVISLTTIFIIGINNFITSYHNENIILSFINEEETYSLIRSISNGYIVKKEKEMLFFPKENLIKMNIKERKKNDK